MTTSPATIAPAKEVRACRRPQNADSKCWSISAFTVTFSTKTLWTNSISAKRQPSATWKFCHALTRFIRGQHARAASSPWKDGTQAKVERQIIKLQEEVLNFHRARQGYAVTEAEYNAQIEAYTNQMQQLESRRSELQSTSNKYSAFQNWLDTFKETAATGDIYDPDNAAVMKAMVEYIVVHRDSMEIHLKCGVTVEKGYV